jgi:hypothetical protein
MAGFTWKADVEWGWPLINWPPPHCAVSSYGREPPAYCHAMPLAHPLHAEPEHTGDLWA